MKVYTYSEARQRLSSLLDEALREGEGGSADCAQIRPIPLLFL